MIFCNYYAIRGINMDVNLDKMSCNLSCYEELSPLEYFKQFNVYKNIQIIDKKLDLQNIENTNPEVEVYSAKLIDAKVVDTMKGISLEGQRLSGKNLIIVGNISLSLILNYSYYESCKKNKSYRRGQNKKVIKDIIEVNIPFSTFIVVPTDICDEEGIELRYFIEDVTVIKLCIDQIFVSVTMIIQYLDENIS